MIKSILLLAMGLSFKEQISSYIRSLPNVERKYDPMSEEAYFYGLRNFVGGLDGLRQLKHPYEKHLGPRFRGDERY